MFSRVDSARGAGCFFSRSVGSDSLPPHGPQHGRPPCPSPTPRACSNSCPSSRRCHPTISSSVVVHKYHRLEGRPAFSKYQLPTTSTLGPQTHLKSVTRFPFYCTSLQESHICPSYVPYIINVSSQAAKMLSKFQTHPKPFTCTSLSTGAFNCVRHSSSPLNPRGASLCHEKFDLRYGCSVQFSCSVVSDSLRPHGLQPGLPDHHQLPEFTQAHVHRVGDAIQPSRPLSSPSPPAFNLSQHQGPVSQLFASGGQSIGVSASASVLPVNIQD